MLQETSIQYMESNRWSVYRSYLDTLYRGTRSETTQRFQTYIGSITRKGTCFIAYHQKTETTAYHRYLTNAHQWLAQQDERNSVL
jgi:hypothetical protein